MAGRVANLYTVLKIVHSLLSPTMLLEVFGRRVGSFLFVAHSLLSPLSTKARRRKPTSCLRLRHLSTIRALPALCRSRRHLRIEQVARQQR